MSSHAPPTPHDPTPAEAKVLFDLISTKFPTATLGPEKWYILVLSALVSGGQPQLAAPLYTHLIAQPEYQTPEQRQRLMRRLRETLFKLIVIVGVCRPLEAVLEIESVLERDEDRDWSFSREGWQCDDANAARGRAWMDRIYTVNKAGVDDMLASQKDFAWTSQHITYGLYLSDQRILSDIETELTVLAGIMMQNLPRETAWHLRGTRRIGVSLDDTETVQQCIEEVAKVCRVSLHRVPRVADVEAEV